MVLRLLQLGFDTIIIRIFGNGSGEDMKLARHRRHHRRLTVVPLEEVNDVSIDDGGFATDDLGAAGLDTGGLKPGNGVAMLSLAAELDDAAVAVQVQAVEGSDVSLDLLATAAADIDGDRFTALMELFEMLHVVDEGVGNGCGL